MKIFQKELEELRQMESMEKQKHPIVMKSCY